MLVKTVVMKLVKLLQQEFFMKEDLFEFVEYVDEGGFNHCIFINLRNMKTIHLFEAKAYSGGNDVERGFEIFSEGSSYNKPTLHCLLGISEDGKRKWQSFREKLKMTAERN